MEQLYLKEPEILGAKFVPGFRQVIWCISHILRHSPTGSKGVPCWGLQPISDFSLMQTRSHLKCSWEVLGSECSFGQPSANRAQGLVGKCPAASVLQVSTLGCLQGPRGLDPPPIAPSPAVVTLIMTLVLASPCPYFTLPSPCLLLPGITFQINHQHPNPVSGSAFGEPSPG